MDNKEELEQTAGALRDSVSAGAAANVDDILSEILGGNGDYSSEYSSMISKYKTDPAESPDAPAASGGAFPRRNYTEEADEALAAKRRAEERISRKMAPSVRGTVQREGQETVRPEFTYDGSVRYPTYGVGESGERVVYDADWEDRAKEEAARIGGFHPAAPRQENSYAGQFRFTGAEEAPRRHPSEPRPKPAANAARAASDIPLVKELPEKQPLPDNALGAMAGEQLNVPPEFLAVQSREAEAEAEPQEDRGLSPEKQRTVDNAVLEAFSSDFDSDAAFKERWKDTVEKARRRKEQLAKAKEEEEARRRSMELQEERERRIAQMEDEIEKSPPPSQKGYFTPAPDLAEAFAAAAAEVQDYPAAERLDEATAERARASAASRSTIKKTRGEKFSFFMRSRFSKEGWRRFARRNLPAKGDSAKEVIRKLIMDISFVALVCALAYLAVYYHNYRARIKNYDGINTDIEKAAEIPVYDLDDAWAQMRALYPDVDFPEGMNIKFAKTYAMNSDTVGQLTIQETKDGVTSDRIRTVLLQNDYEDYYLYKDFYKKYSRYGSPYVSKRCNMGPEGLSRNTIIYGHNTHDHLIFNRLEDYMKVDGYLSAPIITLDTLYETTKWKIFAVMLTNADPIDNNGYVFDYLYSSFGSGSAFMAKMKQIQARSMIHTGVDVQETDKTLMLYTCYRYRFNSGRLVIVARQLREGESEEINSSLVYYDSSAIFPAAYYTGTPTTTEPTSEETAKAPENTKAAESSNEGTTAAEPAGEPTEAAAQTPAEEPAATEQSGDQTAAPPEESTTAAPPATEAPPETTAAPSAEQPQSADAGT